MTFRVQAYIHRIDFFYGSCEVAREQMIVTFWHVNWETFNIAILKTKCVYLKPLSFSVSIKINKHCSYSVHICIQELILTIFMFSLLQKNMFDRWRYETIDLWSKLHGQKQSVQLHLFVSSCDSFSMSAQHIFICFLYQLILPILRRAQKTWLKSFCWLQLWCSWWFL